MSGFSRNNVSRDLRIYITLERSSVNHFLVPYDRIVQSWKECSPRVNTSTYFQGAGMAQSTKSMKDKAVKCSFRLSRGDMRFFNAA